MADRLGLTGQCAPHHNDRLEDAGLLWQRLVLSAVISRVPGFLEVGERKVRFVHEMANRANGVVAAICEITGVSLNFETRRSQALPEEILDRARALVVDYDFAAVRPGG